MILFLVINFWFRCSNAKQLKILDIPWIKCTIILVHERRQWLLCVWLICIHCGWHIEWSNDYRSRSMTNIYICYYVVLNVFPLCCLYFICGGSSISSSLRLTAMDFVQLFIRTRLQHIRWNFNYAETYEIRMEWNGDGKIGWLKTFRLRHTIRCERNGMGWRVKVNNGFSIQAKN